MDTATRLPIYYLNNMSPTRFFVKLESRIIMNSYLYVSSSSTMCGCLSMWQMVASRFRSSRLSPGDAVNLATSTILTANSSAVCRWRQRRTSENGPLPRTERAYVRTSVSQ